MSNSVVWVDIPATNLDRAIAFYSAVLGSAVTKEGGPGFVFGLLPHSGTDVGGCVYVADHDNAPSKVGPLIYLNAQGRLAQAVQAAIEHGGLVLQAIHQIGPHGSRAIVLDSEGNRIALHAAPA
ncbi:MAG: VOC family protein [Burkholderiales bacterium]|nr:VOC family protein [Burkholderiales bacterium]